MACCTGDDDSMVSIIDLQGTNTPVLVCAFIFRLTRVSVSSLLGINYSFSPSMKNISFSSPSFSLKCCTCMITALECILST